MHPVLFQIGSMTIYTYGVLVATGVIVGLFLSRWQARKLGLDPDQVWNVGIYMVLVALAGSKLWLVLGDLPYYWHNPREIFSYATLQSGGDIYGGVIFGLLFLLLYVRKQKLGYFAVADAFAAPLALGHAIGRMGCFTAGCCWGKPTTMPWGIIFTNPLAAQLVGTPLNVRLQPTELYGAGAELINFFLLIWLGRRQKFTGELVATWMILYGFERGIIEFYRGDPGRGMMFNGAISFMQIVSVGLIFFGTWLFLKHRTQKLPAVVPEPARH
ncbi:MAG TPA: prolipoprotein diacylglyceryl transferase [Patescibacteria group bacterium]|nr:prolipoprotein diacylglyceryl transferase [Patescibacteria group bacterium]